VKTYIEELLTTFSGFHQTIFSFLTAHSLQQLFPQLTAHSNFFHSHSPTKQTLNDGEYNYEFWYFLLEGVLFGLITWDYC
jgi:hypothetical protein